VHSFDLTANQTITTKIDIKLDLDLDLASCYCALGLKVRGS